ncbi:MAG: hypothetical protein QG670_193 [Thermoproteota archaeon]|nr:hypothetical protein [Thermoproteota archaeon]
MTTEFKVIGTKPIRPDVIDKVMGRAIFAPDIMISGLLHGKILRSPYAHARILSIDTSAAEALPGVYAVITSKDLPQTPADNAELKYSRDNFLAGEKVLYEGHPIAAVAADSIHTAEDAIKLIRINYEILTPIMDMREAMKENSPKLHENIRLKSLGQDNGRPGNISLHVQHILGDPEKGFAEADEIVDREFTTTMVHQGYLEAQSSTVLWNPDGNLTVWTTTQGAFSVQSEISRILDISLSKIRVIPTEVGGAFGSKLRIYIEPVVVLLSKFANRPVKITMTQSEVLKATGPTPGTIMRVKMGAKRNGKITSATAELYFEAGAFPGSTAGGSPRLIFTEYDIPNGQVDAFEVLVNKTHVGAYRAPGDVQVTYSMEQVVDELAQKVNMDPIDFRLINVAHEGSISISGTIHKKIGAQQVLEAVKNHPHYKSPLKEANMGRGVAFGYWPNNGRDSSCIINVNSDGSVTLVTGSVDLSGTRLTIAMQAAEVLGISVDQVKSSVGDTSSIGYTGSSGGSRTTFATGLAAIQAAKDVINQMSIRAASLLNVPVSEITFERGFFTTSTSSSAKLSFSELAGKLNQTGGPITGKGNVSPSSWGAGFACHIADVEVDPETGKVSILRYTAIQDVGKAVHPTLVEGQMQGAVVQGIGWALWEGLFYDTQGRMLNSNRLDYKIATFVDIPHIETELIEVPSPFHPFGVRGVAEPAFVPPTATIANAVADALGKRIYSLPMTPEKILRTMDVID